MNELKSQTGNNEAKLNQNRFKNEVYKLMRKFDGMPGQARGHWGALWRSKNIYRGSIKDRSLED